MAFELVYTSAPAGLARGSSGFCVVACTQGLGPRLMVTLEGLSAYKPLYPHYAPNAWDNPISRSHYLYQANGEMQHILSRTCFNGVDHTQRSNKLASHLVLSEAEAGVAQGGPSSLLLQEELFKDANWEIKAEYFPTQRSIPRTYASYAKCTTWESVMGDAGWGGYLAQLYLDSPNRNVYIAYNPGQDNIILPLLHEALSLLPEQLRWQVTFNTYFVNLPAGMSCSWRCCPIDSDALRMAKRSPVNVVIDITRPQALNSDSELITLARTGVKDEPADEQPQEVTEELPVLTNDVSETSGVVRLSVSNTQSIVNNPPVNLNVISANDPRNVQFDYRNPGVTQARSKRGFLITCLVLLAIAIAAGAFYMVTNIQEKQLYDEQRAIFRQRMEVFNDYKERRSAADKQQANLKTQENVEDLIYVVSDLLKLVESIQAEVEKLKEHQQLFEAYIDYNDLASSNDTPKTLINACEQEKKYLIKYLAKLNDIKQEIIQRNERIARQMQKKAKPVAAVPVTPAPVVPKAEPKKPGKKLRQSPKKLPQKSNW